ncbi:ATP-binding protein [Bombella sp. TMW 2.2559]|uniref:ATP-binding protein n=1 Tax=Bombella dulcis TaxID=2967339 RepID=A0ABT3WCQ4_9PROT|nr:AAA family ATPase [Bombella dulcis]MCX5616854.1 ATP-binding protein [Bombella dulcis]
MNEYQECFLELDKDDRKSFLEEVSFYPNSPDHRPFFISTYTNQCTIFLDGHNRMDIINQQPIGNLHNRPVLSFQKLFRNNNLRNEFRNIIFRGFNRYVVMDPTDGKHLRLRLSPTPPISDDLEKGLNEPSIEFHKKAHLVSESSDGLKSFIGIISEIIAGDPRLILIDEPEAFLHPPLAFKLGLEIARLLSQTDGTKQMLAATHSSHFLMGCIQAGVPINIVRLTHREGHAAARMLESKRISHLMKNPLLRSTGVMAGLFYESVIVTEADSDRAFYQEINERLLEAGRGIPNCLFLNAQNKQTIPEILAPLREIGIPAAAICDIDFFKCGNDELNKFLKSANIPEPKKKSLREERADINERLKKSEKEYKSKGGISILKGDDLQFAKEHIKYWKDYGIFIIPHGELENWLPELQIPKSRHGSKWLIPAFEKMGDDPSKDDYVRPAKGDVWDFIDQIAEWLNNPKRKGIPPQTPPMPTE